MLRAPDARVLDVAVACGFKTSSTLHRSFVISVELAPQSIRQELVGSQSEFKSDELTVTSL